MLLCVRSGIRWFGLAAIAAMVGCDTDSDPQVQLDGTGAIDGFLFFDVSEDGQRFITTGPERQSDESSFMEFRVVTNWI